MMSTAVNPSAASTLRQAREVPMARDKDVRAKPGRAQARFRARQLDGIDVEPDADGRPAARARGSPARGRRRRACSRPRPRRAAAAGSASTSSTMIGTVRPCRRLAGRENLLHLRGVPLGVQLLVFLVEPARVPARIPRTPRVHRGLISGLLLHVSAPSPSSGATTWTASRAAPPSPGDPPPGCPMPPFPPLPGPPPPDRRSPPPAGLLP